MAAEQREAVTLLDGATDGPWVHNGSNGVFTQTGTCIALTRRHDDDQRVADAELIAAAPRLLAGLLEENARLRAENAALTKTVHDVGELWDRETSRGRPFLADPRVVPELRAILGEP